MKQFLLLMLFIACCVTVLKLYTRSGKRLTAAQAKARLDTGDPVVLLDVRTEAEFAEGHIPGAVCLPLDALERDAARVLPDKSAEILVYCRSGARSAKAVRTLASLGYTHAADFGGIQSWPYRTTQE